MGQDQSQQRRQQYSQPPSRAVAQYQPPQSRGVTRVSKEEDEPSKIDLAVLACAILVRELMSENDRCCIASFSNTFNIVTNFTDDGARLGSALRYIHQNVSGSTRLYDSLKAASDHFRVHGRRDAVWIMLAVTDGNDDDSSPYAPMRHAGSLDPVWGSQQPTNFGFLLGVGKDVRVSALKACADSSGLSSLPVQSFALLGEIFKRLLTQVQVQVQGLVVSDGQRTAVMERTSLAVTRIPLDILVLMDVSGSMNEAA